MADVLVIHDQPHLRSLLIEHCRRADRTAAGATTVADAIRAADGEKYPIVLVGVGVGDCGAAVDRARRTWPHAAIIAIGPSRDSAAAAEATRQGAGHYLAVPADLGELAPLLFGLANHQRDQDSHGGDPSDDAVVIDPLTREVFARADRAAAVNSTVLITGESGTGKEVLARRIHRNSSRRRGKFIPVNCGSLPNTLIETELFGYRKGAFTGAASDRKGLIEEAEGGVLFLDEIGDMPPGMQVRLLRFLDSGEIRAVGGTSVRHVDVRVIAATNRCLESAIRDKQFREDLFFRLSVVSLRLPPLRERRSDIPALVEYHARRAARRLQVPVPRIADETLAILTRHHWPGNVRELQNALEQALVQETSGTITPRSLPTTMLVTTTPASPGHSVPKDHEHLLHTLRAHRGNHTEAAAALGISRTTLWRRLKHIRVDTAPVAAVQPAPSVP